MKRMMGTLLLVGSMTLSACIPTLSGLTGVLAGSTPQVIPSPAPSAATASPAASPSPTANPSPTASASASVAAPVASSPISVTGMKVSGCAEEGTLRSATGPSTNVRFTNNSEGRVTVYWLNSLGRRVEYRKLAKGESYDQQTYVTHPWLITGEQGQCLGIYTPESAAKATLVINPTGTAGSTVTPGGSTAPGPLGPVTELSITEARAREGVVCLRAKGETSLATAFDGKINVYLQFRAILGDDIAKRGYLAPAAKVLIEKGC
jgi:hypothetical protein